ncbi:MAG TPA: prepilin peptidase [Dongiaceae bacterium]|nr:prepilin peptidase [Dongiaceae bacterium]
MILLIIAAIGDITRYRISNRLVVAIAAAFAVGLLFNFSWPALGWSAGAGITMFGLGAALFALGLFGGGDVKLIAAMALWTGVAGLPRFLLIMTAVGGVLGVIWLLRRKRSMAKLAFDPGAALPGGSPPIPNKLPYGVAIAIAGLDFFLTAPHSPLAPLLPWI